MINPIYNFCTHYLRIIGKRVFCRVVLLVLSLFLSFSFCFVSLPFFTDNTNKMEKQKGALAPQASFWTSFGSAFGSIFNPSIVLMLVILCLGYFLQGFVYFGAVWQPTDHLTNIKVGIVNEDLGVDLTAFGSPGVNFSAGSVIQSMLTVSAVFDFEILAMDFDSAYDKLVEEDFWILIHIPANFSNGCLLASAVNSSSAAYSHSMAPAHHDVHLYFDEGRSYNSFSLFNRIWRNLAPRFSVAFPQTLLTTSLKDALNPEFLLRQVRFVHNSFHTVKYYGQNFSTYIIPIVCMVGAMATCHVLGKFTVIECAGLGPDKRVSALSVVMGYITIAFGLAIFETLFTSVVLFIWGGDFDQSIWLYYGAIFLMMITCHIIVFFLLAVFGKDWFFFPAFGLMMFWIATSGGIFAQELAVAIYKIGQGFHFYYAINLFRYVFFGSLEANISSDVLMLFVFWLLLIPAVAISCYRINKRWAIKEVDRPAYRGPTWSDKQWSHFSRMFH
eukprot:GCRY01000231.1.p1 GENE.GCRY01000231.1~~GCRY01000231.1.p1  ORF type:complete len:500 (+),score=84.85 GCRY01000231.1:68-1567(+)